MLVEFSIGIAEHYKKEVIEFDDNTTDEELQKCYDIWALNNLDMGICKVDMNLINKIISN